MLGSMHLWNLGLRYNKQQNNRVIMNASVSLNQADAYTIPAQCRPIHVYYIWDSNTQCLLIDQSAPQCPLSSGVIQFVPTFTVVRAKFMPTFTNCRDLCWHGSLKLSNFGIAICDSYLCISWTNWYIFTLWMAAFCSPNSISMIGS